VELMTKAFGSNSRMAIIGAGIGGLTFSISPQRHGVAAEVFEQAHELTEIGAAVALSANGTRELDRFGLLDQPGAVSTEPTELIYCDGRTSERIAAHPVRIRGAYGERFGAPFCGLHRAELQRVLGAAVDHARLHIGRRVVRFDDRDGRIGLTFAGGSSAEADLVVAADGVRSIGRRYVAGDDRLVYSQTSGFGDGLFDGPINGER
jgi:salicylate hydroxylase